MMINAGLLLMVAGTGLVLVTTSVVTHYLSTREAGHSGTWVAAEWDQSVAGDATKPRPGLLNVALKTRLSPTE